MTTLFKLVAIAAVLTPQFQVTRLGYYNPFLLLGTTLTSIAAGLYTTLTIYSGRAEWIGYQIISGLGIGFILQMV